MVSSIYLLLQKQLLLAVKENVLNLGLKRWPWILTVKELVSLGMGGGGGGEGEWKCIFVMS